MPHMPHINEISADKLETLSACPYCSSTEHRFMFEENGFPYLSCKGCRLIYLKTRIREQHLDLIYNDESYHSIESPEYQLMIGKKRLALFGKLPEGGRIHEDACGSGFFAKACVDQGLNLTASDLGDDSINKSKQAYGIDVQKGSLEDLKIASASLDALASFNLISHLYQPWDYFSEIERILKPGGLAVMRTGNRKGFFYYLGWGHWSAPEHVFHVDEYVMKRMAEQAGLVLEKVKPAFDSDFPFIFDPPKSKVIRKVASITVRAWAKLSLPSDDAFYMIRKKK